MSNIIEVLGKEKIKYRSRNLLNKSLLPERIEIVESLDYKLYVHDSMPGVKFINCCTIILTSHGNRVDYFKKSVESILSQTSGNFELILVDHGCELELKNLIHDYFLTDVRIKLIVFSENLYNPKEKILVEERFSNVLNAALFCSEGEFVYFLSYDDFLSENYISCVIPLFLDNKDCVVVAPAVASVDEASVKNKDVTNSLYEINSLRKRYMNGIDLANSVIQGFNKFSAPGGLFCYRTNLVLVGGGFDCMNDYSQIFKFAVLGDVGTSMEAVLYWRHHSNQTNRANIKLGVLYYAIFHDWVNHINKFYIANNISESYQKNFSEYMENRLRQHSISCIRDSIRSGLQGTVGIFAEIVKTAPRMYIYFFFITLLTELPYFIYNYVPEEIKGYYRTVRDARTPPRKSDS